MEKQNILKYSKVYNEVAEIIGDDKIKEFCLFFQGQQVLFPMKLYSADYVVNEILQSDGEKSVAEFAKTYGYSERYLRKLLQKRKEEMEKENRGCGV